MPRFPRPPHALAAVVVAALAATSARADLPPHDQYGGHSIIVAFDLPTLLESGYVQSGGFTEQRYCDLFQNFSHHLWQSTEQQHFVRRVEFRLGTQEADTNWFFRPQGETSWGGGSNSTAINENYGSGNSPANNSPLDPGYDPNVAANFDSGLAWLLNHEYGHFLYHLSDEYVRGRTKGATLGICSGWRGGTCELAGTFCFEDTECPGSELCIGEWAEDACQEDADCLNGETCILQERRNGTDFDTICSDYDPAADPSDFTVCADDSDCDGDATCVDDKVLFKCTGDDAGDYCDTDADCQQGGSKGVCVKEGELGQADSRRVCRAGASPVAGEPDYHDDTTLCSALADPGDCKFRNRTSIMSSSGGGGRWCDPSSHRHTRYIERGYSGGYTREGNPANDDPEFELTLDPAYSTWERAVQTDLADNDPDLRHPDLRSYYDGRSGYPAWTDLTRADFDTWLASREPGYGFDCVWNIDEEPIPGDNTMLLVDASGSMDYVVGTGTNAKMAYEHAAEGAVVLLDITEPANYVGVMTYSAGDPGTTVIRDYDERGPDALDDDAYDDLFGGTGPGGSTDIGQAIAAAVSEMSGVGPTGNRNIVVMSDGVNTEVSGPTPLEAAIDACNQGIVVNTIAYGNADAAWLDELADVSCDGESMVAGTEGETLEGPEPHLLKTAFVRMKHVLSGHDEIFSDKLTTLEDGQDTYERLFYVPIDSGPLQFTWLGNEVKYCPQAVGTSVPVCDAPSIVFDDLTFEIESPSGDLYPGLHHEGYGASAVVAGPEPGWWIARADASAVPTTADYAINVRALSKLSWLANITHPDLLAKAWIADWKQGLNQPVLINASLYFKAPLSRIAVLATVTYRGVQYGGIWLRDDGQSGDNQAGDGIYGGWFNPDGDWATWVGRYNVNVQMLSIAPISKAVHMESFDESDEAEDPEPVLAASAYAVAETSFHLSDRHLWPGSPNPNDPGNDGHGGVTLNVDSFTAGERTTFRARVRGFQPVPGKVSVSLGPDVVVKKVKVRPVTRRGTPDGAVITFKAKARKRARPGERTLFVVSGSDRATARVQLNPRRPVEPVRDKPVPEDPVRDEPVRDEPARDEATPR
jgi:hypothetical protein